MPTYLSKEKLKEMETELETRRMVTRKEIASRLEAAKELGDLSENFEYHEAKDQQALNETRIVDLEGMVKDAVLVEQKSGGEIELGSRFVAEVAGKGREFEIVGSNEADPMAGKISNESPLGQAFIGRGAGEEVEVAVPSGTISYRIVDVR
ncbi:transcription elongation factor GreA [Patescibacteria group bacterium]|nr:MAG: transcription elongation factor GreA [Patescibacteria group bacterium]